MLNDNNYPREASMKRGDPLNPKFEQIPSTALGTTQELEATPGLVENTSGTTSKKPSQNAANHSEFLNLAPEKENIFSWYAGVFSDTSTEDTLKDSEIRQQDRSLGVHTDGKLEEKFIVDENKIADTLTTMHLSLCTSEFKKYREYRKCPSGTASEVNARLAALMKEDEQTRHKLRNGDSRRRHSITDSIKNDSPIPDRAPHLSASKSDSEDNSTSGRDYHWLLKRKIRFVRVMKKLFQLFLPLSNTSEMSAKYWGAINFLLQVLALESMTA